MNKHKRKYRNDVPEDVKLRIAGKLKGRIKSKATREKISRSMRRYWSSLPMKPGTSVTNEKETKEKFQ